MYAYFNKDKNRRRNIISIEREYGNTEITVENFSVDTCSLIERKSTKGGTYIHPEIFVHFASYVSPKFEILIRKVFILFSVEGNSFEVKLSEKDREIKHLKLLLNKKKIASDAMDEKLQNEISKRTDVEERLQNEISKRTDVEGELQSEIFKRTDAEEELQKTKDALRAVKENLGENMSTMEGILTENTDIKNTIEVLQSSERDIPVSSRLISSYKKSRWLSCLKRNR